MEKRQLTDFRNNNIKCINRGEFADVYLIDNEKILKIFKIKAIKSLKKMGIDLETKILSSENVQLDTRIIKPEIAIYKGLTFIGYITSKAKGIDFNTWDKYLTLLQREDLYMYADIHYKLENIIKSNPNIVFPDICTCDNIYVNDGEVELIDYDGLQIENHSSFSFSTTLGNPNQYCKSSKYNKNNLFTKELDKKSLILLYFLNVFNIDLNKVGLYNPSIRKTITLDDVFECIGLKDNDFMHKVWKIFNDKEINDYLGKDVYRIAETYRMKVLYPIPIQDSIYIKKLTLK